MTNEQKQTYTRRISAANRAQLVTVVYDMTLDYMAEGRGAVEARQRPEADSALTHARACLDDLIGALDMQYELSGRLRELYFFCKKECTLAQGRMSTEHIDNASRVITQLRDAWVQIEDSDESEALFDNAQTVYAGLTYGKGTLNESVANPASNRGLTV